MKDLPLTRDVTNLSTPLITDAALRLKIPLCIAPPGIRPIIAGQRLAARYLEERATNPRHTFREHLREIRGAIEE